MTTRNTGIKVLETILTKKTNINIIEKYVYVHTHNETDYLKLLYEIVYLLHESKNITKTVASIIENVHNNKYGWNNVVYDSFREKIEEEDQFITHPFEIEEGVIECFKCNSKRTVSYQRQTRSADEGATTFAQCVDCKTRWRHNN
jgi:DNA-directed RNA polymerase subunit M/transcription elongation factor TFIIS